MCTSVNTGLNNKNNGMIVITDVSIFGALLYVVKGTKHHLSSFHNNLIS